MDNKLQNAKQDHDLGYNCAQSVLKQFCAEHQLPEQQALMLSSGFGGGMRIGTVCGAISGGLIALGLAYGFTNPAHKTDIDSIVLDFIARFKETMGALDCRDLIGIDTCDPVQKSFAKEQGVYAEVCPLAISTAVQLVESLLAEKGKQP